MSAHPLPADGEDRSRTLAAPQGRPAEAWGNVGLRAPPPAGQRRGQARVLLTAATVRTFNALSYVSVLLIGLGVTLCPGSFAVEIVRDRERKVRPAHGK